MASGGRRQIFGGSTSITKSRRWRPQINGGGSAGARLYLKDFYPICLLFLLLLFFFLGFFSSFLQLFLLLFSSSVPSAPLLHLFLLLLFSSFLSFSSPPSHLSLLPLLLV